MPKPTTPKIDPKRLRSCLKAVGFYIKTKMPKPILAAFSASEITAAGDQLIDS